MNDTVVQPRESEWFGFYAPGQDKTVLPLEQTPLYQQVCTTDSPTNQLLD
jgi:palmitoyl-protein thioesterase